MDNDSITDIAWPVNIESIAKSANQPTLKKHIEKPYTKKYRRCFGIVYYPCSLWCLALLLLLVVIILAIIIALLIIFVGKNNQANAMLLAINSTEELNYTTNITEPTVTNASATAVKMIMKMVMAMTTTVPVGTTTTPLSCGQSCLNESWISSAHSIARWPFDGSYTDIINGHNGFPSAYPPAFATGYILQAASFNASQQQAMHTSFIPLYNVSFTIDAWIKPTGYPNPENHSIVGLCPSKIVNKCLHINIRNKKLYFGFYNDDLQGGTEILLNEWIHVAFSFDKVTSMQTIYLNGYLDGQHKASTTLEISSGNFTVGTNEGVNFGSDYFQGYIDQLSIAQRLKSSCEILEIATLAARFKFDIPSPYTDSGPNEVATTYLDTSIVVGYLNQAISFSGVSMSYFQASGLTSLGISNRAFSLALRIQPQKLSGTLAHLSTSSLGTGSQCFPLLGFASNGAIVAQVLINNNTVVSATGPILPVSSTWIEIVQTWSSTNGLRLYVNNTLVSSVVASTFLGSETTPNYLTLGNCLNGRDGRCHNGLVGQPGPFTGAIDDFRLYSRELTMEDVCTLTFIV